MKLFISKIHYKKQLNIFEKIVYYILKILGYPYSLAIQVRNKLYDKGILRSYTSKSFVISVGNITTGGVGKTPFTLELAKYYMSLNKKVAILLRGYGSKLNIRKPNIISDGSGAFFPASVAGDEPVWLAENAKGAYVVTCASRVKAEKYIKDKFNPDIIILDDGFQHRKMKRDLDIVLIDAKNKFGNKSILPSGPLRENFDGIKRADKIVIVNKNYDDKDALKYCDYLKKQLSKDIYLCKLVPDYAYDIITNKKLENNTKIMAFSAIGQPQSFYEFLKDDYRLSAILEFEDHHSYDREDISKIIGFAQEENVTAVVTTEKDAVKIKDIIKDVEMPVRFYALKLKAYVDIRDICGV